MRHPRQRSRRHKKRQFTLPPLNPTLRRHMPHISEHPWPEPHPVEKGLVGARGDQVRRGGGVEGPCFGGEGLGGYVLEVVG